MVGAVSSSSAWRKLIPRAVRASPWLPAAIGVLYLLVLALKTRSLIAGVYLNADVASAPVMGDLLHGPIGARTVILGDMPWYSTLMFELLTRWLPAHRTFWELIPFAMWLTSAALVAAGVWRLAGKWAGATAAVIGVCAGPAALEWLLAMDAHAPTWLSLCVLGGVALLLYGPPAWLTTSRAVAIVVLAGVIVGVNTASDVTLAAAGLLPLAAASVIVAVLVPRRATLVAGLWVVGLLLVSGVFYEFTLVLMRHLHVERTPVQTPLAYAAPSSVSGNFQLWWQSLMVVGDGDFFGAPPGIVSTLEMLCGLLSLVAVLAIPFLIRRELQRTATKIDVLSAVWLFYWSIAAVMLSLIFVLSNAAEDIQSNRYLVGVIFCVAAVLPVLATKHRLVRPLLIVGATVFALTGVATLLKNDQAASKTGTQYVSTPGYDAQFLPTADPQYTSTTGQERVYNQLARIAKQYDLSIGYAGYWDAAPLTWISHERLKVYPVANCSAGICMFALHAISTWYAPPWPDVSTFLLEDTSKPAFAQPTPQLGAPSHVFNVGPVTMYVYPYDIAKYIALTPSA